MKQKCDNCGDWLEYTDTADGYDWYVCIGCGKEYKFELVKEENNGNNQ